MNVKAMLYSILSIMLLVAGCSSDDAPSAENEKPVTLTFAFELPQSHPWGHGAETFKKIVEEKTNGQIKIDLYSGGTLGGSGREIQEGVAVGTIDIGISSTPIVLLNPYQEIFSLPYIFKNREHAWKVLDGPIGEKVGKHLEEKNLKVLAYWEDGFRQVTNNIRPITSPEDFKGLKIRVPESPVRIKTFEALGASPIAMSWSEVFTGLQQGTLDGQENPLSAIESASLYDVQKYLTITNHVYSPATLFINLDKWNSLTEEQQNIILEAAAAGRDVNRELNQKGDQELLTVLQEKGMEVVIIDDVTPFQELTKSVWPIVTQELGEEGQQIIDEIGKQIP
ncbi:MAG: TRAP transporter substrate-binding protein [Brevibacillus sp.]|nr:TRAP transporter substrate-binding protein [Brevibacillus sp.]